MEATTEQEGLTWADEVVIVRRIRANGKPDPLALSDVYVNGDLLSMEETLEQVEGLYPIADVIDYCGAHEDQRIYPGHPCPVCGRRHPNE